MLNNKDGLSSDKKYRYFTYSSYIYQLPNALLHYDISIKNKLEEWWNGN